MLATDAVFSRRPLALDIGKGGLGQWECHEWPDLFIAQPGVYWSPSDLSDLVKSWGLRGPSSGRRPPVSLKFGTNGMPSCASPAPESLYQQSAKSLLFPSRCASSTGAGSPCTVASLGWRGIGRRSAT
jgi:hypothetical protein